MSKMIGSQVPIYFKFLNNSVIMVRFFDQNQNEQKFPVFREVKDKTVGFLVAISFLGSVSDLLIFCSPLNFRLKNLGKLEAYNFHAAKS